MVKEIHVKTNIGNPNLYIQEQWHQNELFTKQKIGVTKYWSLVPEAPKMEKFTHHQRIAKSHHPVEDCVDGFSR